MKGVVFTEFLELVEEKFGYEVADHIIETSNLPNKGAYTAVGTYPFGELATMLGKLSEHTKIPASDLLVAFGHHLFNTFIRLYGHFFEGIKDSFDFLTNIEGYIHVEVKKLYPDAELPSIKTEQIDDKTLILHYVSKRKLAHLAFGLIEKSLEHFKQKANIKMENKDDSGENVTITVELTD
ncbi:MAG: heme NO-binding domain-containing protein [Bacteroidia bacterium]